MASPAHSRFSLRMVLLLAGVVAAASAFATPKKDWTITALQSLPSTVPFARAEAVNNRGDIVGWSTMFDPAVNGNRTYAMVWRNGRAMNLGEGMASAINEHGVIAGSTDEGDGVTVWIDGELRGYDTPGAPFDINRSGTIAGWHIGPFPHAYILTADGVTRDLGTLGGSQSTATGINDKGQVTGYANLPGDTVSHAFVWNNGVMKDLGTLNGGSESRAHDINNHGVIVGEAWDAFGNSQPFIYDGAMRQLFSGRCVVPSAINDRGDVVGTMDCSASFLWEDGVLTRLESIPAVQAAGWTQLIPTDINDRGWIVGMGRKGAAVPPASQVWQAFVLIPKERGR